MISRDIDQLDREFGEESPYLQQFVQASDQTSHDNREAIEAASLHSRYSSVLNNWVEIDNTPAILNKIRKRLEELDGSYLQPLQNAAKTLMANH